MFNIWLDDVRPMPQDGEFNVRCSNFYEFKAIIDLANDVGIEIECISFDHDLGEGKTGMDCVKYLVQMDMDHTVLDSHFEFKVHSANPVGKENIQEYLAQYWSTIE